MSTLEEAFETKDLVARYDFEIVRDRADKASRVSASFRIGRVCGEIRSFENFRYVPCSPFYVQIEGRYSLEKHQIPAQPEIIDAPRAELKLKTDQTDNFGLLIHEYTSEVDGDITEDLFQSDTTSLLLAGSATLKLAFQTFADMQFGFKTDDPKSAALAKIYVDLYVESLRHIPK